MYRLDGFAVPAELGRVHALLERAGADHPEVDPTDLMLFDTAVIEIASNVVEHGRPKGGVRWRLVLTIDEAEIRADLFDSSQPFDADLDAPMPEADAPRGRGLPMAAALLDEITVERTSEGNHWLMVRRRADAPQG